MKLRSTEDVLLIRFLSLSFESHSYFLRDYHTEFGGTYHYRGFCRRDCFLWLRLTEDLEQIELLDCQLCYCIFVYHSPYPALGLWQLILLADVYYHLRFLFCLRLWPFGRISIEKDQFPVGMHSDQSINNLLSSVIK